MSKTMDVIPARNMVVGGQLVREGQRVALPAEQAQDLLRHRWAAPAPAKAKAPGKTSRAREVAHHADD